MSLVLKKTKHFNGAKAKVLTFSGGKTEQFEELPLHARVELDNLHTLRSVLLT